MDPQDVIARAPTGITTGQWEADLLARQQPALLSEALRRLGGQKFWWQSPESVQAVNELSDYAAAPDAELVMYNYDPGHSMLLDAMSRVTPGNMLGPASAGQANLAEPPQVPGQAYLKERGLRKAREFLAARTPKPDPLDVIMARGAFPDGKPATGPFFRTDQATGERILDRQRFASASPEDRAQALQFAFGKIADADLTDVQMDASRARQGAVDAMIADTQAKARQRLLAENPSLRGTPFATGGDPRDILARQMVMTPRERAMESILNGADGQRAAELRGNPALADRIQAERQLTQAMQPMEVATANTSDARANQLLEQRGILKNNELALAARAGQPRVVPIDQEKFQAAVDRRRAARDLSQQMVSAIARGRQGMVSKDDVMNMMLMRTPGVAEALLRGQQGAQDNLVRMELGKMGIEAERQKNDNYLRFQTDRDRENNATRIEAAKISAGPPDLTLEQKLKLKRIEGSGLPDQEKARLQSEVLGGAAVATPAPLPPSMPNSFDSAVDSLIAMNDTLTPDMARMIVQGRPDLFNSTNITKLRDSTIPGFVLSGFEGAYYPENHNWLNYLGRAMGTARVEPAHDTELRAKKRRIADMLMGAIGITPAQAGQIPQSR